MKDNIRNKKTTNISYFGIPGSYSFQAAKKYFSVKNSKYVNNSSFKDACSSVIKGISEFAVIPLENSLTGSIYESYDLLLKNNLKITGEIIMKIDHCLLIRKKDEKLMLKDKKISVKCFTHPEVFKQCSNFFNTHNNIIPVMANDTAQAAKILQESKDRNICAISNSEASKIYNLRIFKKNISDNLNNYTRFVVLGKNMNASGNKISLVFTILHKPGSLVEALKTYAKYGFNLTKIESKPIHGKPWEYTFYVDFVSSNNLQILYKFLTAMKRNVKTIKNIGIYSKGKSYES